MTTASGAPTSGASNANFQKLRPVCVNLLRLINKAPDDNALEDALAQLHVCLEVVDALTPSLVHYVFYPVSQLLNTHENGIFSFPNRVRTLIFRVLAQLATDWWQTWTWAHIQSCSKAETCPTTISGSPDWRVWEQLLFLGVMTLSGGPRSSPVQNNYETREATAQFLARVLQPRISQLPPSNDHWEWDGVSSLPSLEEFDGPNQIYPATQHVAAVRDSRASSGALAHALKLALDMSREPSAPASLCRTALTLVGIVSISWMGGCTLVLDNTMQVDHSALRERAIHADTIACSERLRMILPGVASSLVKVATRASSAVNVAYAVDLLTAMLVLCLQDPLTAPYRTNSLDSEVPSSLEDFGKLDINSLMSPNSELEEETETLSAKSEMSTPATSITSDAIENSWLERTMNPVLIALKALVPLGERNDVPVQLAMTRMAHTLLTCMPETLQWARQDMEADPCEDLTCTLLDMSCDWHTERVTQQARDAVRALGSSLLVLMDRIMTHALLSLASAVKRIHDADVQMHARRVRMCASLLSHDLLDVQMGSPHMAFLRVASHHGDFHWWFDALMQAFCVHELTNGVMAADTIPYIRPALGQLEPGSMYALGRMWFAWGEATAVLLCAAVQRRSALSPRYQSAFSLPLYAMHVARMCRITDINRARVHLLVVNEVMLGTSHILTTRDLETWMTLPEGRALRKAAHGFARHVVHELQHAWHAEVEEKEEPEMQEVVESIPTSDTTMVRGLPAFTDRIGRLNAGPALDVSFVDSARIDVSNLKSKGPEMAKKERALERRNAMRDHCDALSLCILASAASLLGVSCRPLLLQILYPVLGAFGRRDEVVRNAAQYALERMSDACAYPSIQSCILHHTDYVLGAASHRLISGLRSELYAGLSIAPIRPTQQTVLMSARAAPWVLVQVIQMLGAEAVPWVEDAVDEVLAALDQFHGHEDVCDGLLAVLARLVAVLAPMQPPKERIQPKMKSPIEDFRQWLEMHMTGTSRDESLADLSVPDEDANQDANPAPNRLQSVLNEILIRCIPFLSHGSAYLRMRALDMLRDGVAILAPQERTAELYPVLDRAWPLILARFGTSATSVSLNVEYDVNVWIHATGLVSTIAQHVSEGFGRRILKDIWPQWRQMLYTLCTDRSAQPRVMPRPERGAVAKRAHVHLYNQHATEGQVLFAILEALKSIASSIGQKMENAVLWDMATHPRLLDTLDVRQPGKIRNAGVIMYQSFIQADDMTLWTILRAVAGQGAPWYLQRSIQWAPEFTW